MLLLGLLVLGLSLLLPSASLAAPGDEAPGEVDAARSEVANEARVASVDLGLTVWRGGDRPGGERRPVPRRRAEVDGVVTYHLQAPAQEGQELILLDFASFMREQPQGLDEIALSNYVAGPAERARTVVEAASVELVGGGQDREVAVLRRGAREDLVLALPEGAASVTLRYRVEVPHRYWPLGCVWRRCSLSGAVAPLPSEPASGGVWLPPEDRVISPVRWDIGEVRFGAVPDWVPGTAPTEDQAKALERQELIVTRDATDPRAPIAYPSIFWGRNWKH
ncbi:MAG: hypothetical protein KC457_32465, partial [Myxococcales bacterium]|nr:hypothetical protein [Myxococcales bacterium]